jgi:hypothetical protein
MEALDMRRSELGTETLARPFTRAEITSIHAYKQQKADRTVKFLTPKQVQASIRAELAVVGGQRAELMTRVADLTNLSPLKVQEVLDAITIEAGKASTRKGTVVRSRHVRAGTSSRRFVGGDIY